MSETYESEGRIVVHPSWVEKAQQYGVGITHCKDVDTGETWKEIDTEAIRQAERDFRRVGRENTLGRLMLTWCVLDHGFRTRGLRATLRAIKESFN